MTAGSSEELLWRTIEGGVCAPQGYRAAGVRCGIKKKGRDLAIVLSETPATVVGAFTTNRVKSPSVLLCQERMASRQSRAVAINSGNANCLTGEQGRGNTERMAEVTARALGLEAHDVLVASTGVIGVQLPMEKVEQGIAEAAASLSRSGGAAAARAIMTTDTKPKEIAVEFTIADRPVRVGAMAKGAGMICPHMATMICIVTTDAAAPVESLELSLRWAVDRSFNCITVDGDMSTSDTVLLFANGASGVRLQKPDHLQQFQQALDHVTRQMARAIVADGEGATKTMEVRVAGAREYADAHRIALTIANSLLVKTALFGADPNWGRFMAAAGRAGVEIEPHRIDLFFGGLQVVRAGEGLDYDEEAARQALVGPEVRVEMDLHLGPHSATVFTCDLTPKYVRFNSAYTT